MGKQQHKGQGKGAASLARPAGGMAIAANWPIHEVLLSRGWDQQAALVTILVARRSTSGKIAVASFLVDLACLGVKSAAVKLYKSASEYVQDMRARYLLNGADPSACPTPVPTGGPEGKPLFVAGPYDDPRRIIDHLMRTVGEGNFHYLVGTGPM